MKILVISPHPDDETLGAGGSLLKFKKEGNKISWLNFTEMSEDYGYSASEVAIRKSEVKKVNKLYVFDAFYDLELRPCFLSDYSRRELIDQVYKILKKIKPEIIILPFKNDSHSDHRVVFDVVYSSVKVFRAPFVKELLMMEILSETDSASSDFGFVPNYFVDISEFIHQKIKILKNYKSELLEHPFPRSIANVKALATYRGATAGCNFAESFMLLRKIV